MPVTRYAGFQEELSFGESPAPEALFHLDIASASLDAKADTMMFYQGGLSRNTRTFRPGFYSPDGDIAFATDIKTIGYFLKWALGGYTAPVAPGAAADVEIQTLALGGATGGTYSLSGRGKIIPLAYDASDAQIQTALETMFGDGMVTVDTGVITFDATIGISGLTGDLENLTGATDPSLTITQAFNPGGFYNHKIFGDENNVLPSFCARIGKDIFEHIFQGCVINSLTIAVEGEFVMMTAGIMSQKDGKTTIKAIADLTLPDEYPLAFYEVGVEKDGVPLDCKVKAITIEIQNNVGQDSGRSVGKLHPCRFVCGERVITISQPKFYETTDSLEELWGSADAPSIYGHEEFEFKVTLDGQEYGFMEMTFPKCIFTSVAQQPSGRDEIVQEHSIRAMLGEYVDGEETIDTDVFIDLYNTVEDLTREET